MMWREQHRRTQPWATSAIECLADAIEQWLWRNMDQVDFSVDLLSGTHDPQDL